MNNSIKITNSDDIQASLQKIRRHYVFTSHQPLCGLLVLLMTMFAQFAIAPLVVDLKKYIYDETAPVKEHIRKNLTDVWSNFAKTYELTNTIDQIYEKLCHF